MSAPPAAGPTSTVPAVPDQAKGQGVEVRSHDGRELVRKVSRDRARALVRATLAQWRGQHLRLKLGIRWIPDLLASNGLPDLDRMCDNEPERYQANWRGSENPKIGRGCVGRHFDSTTLHTPTKRYANL
jgi:hypothetical protein